MILVRLWLATLVAVVALSLAVWALRPVPGEPEIVRDAYSALAGRVLMVGFVGRDPASPAVQATRKRIERGDIAGVMFLRRNVRDEEQVKRLNTALASASTPPPLIALDQEGGRVARLGWRSGFPYTPSAFAVARGGTAGEAWSVYAVMARRLHGWGFNVNFGPVVDLHRADNPIIGRLGRAFSADPREVAAYARAFMEAHAEAGLATALKHFPGHGSSLGDTHLGSVDVTDSWEEEELEPYRTLLAEAPMVMTGHIVNRQLGEGPATLSHAIVTGLLRETLGFEGVVVSDDLQMDAITMPEETAAERALRAGVDLALFSLDREGDPKLVDRIIAHLAAVARRDRAFASRLREAGDRVDRLRERLATGRRPIG